MLTRILPVLLLVIIAQASVGQRIYSNEERRSIALQHSEKEKTLQTKLTELARVKAWPLVMRERNGEFAALVGVDAFGYPIYNTTQNNIIAAATIGTNKLWSGGGLGLNLSGSSANMKDRLAIWDGAKVLSTHVEFNGRVLQKDNPSSFDDHATHVAGTMIAAGVNPAAKGMSYGLQEMFAYDFLSDASEMMSVSGTLLVSNHSYGQIAGWRYNDAESRWEWWGRFDATEDYKFGYYSNTAQMFDSISYMSPSYLIVMAASNKRNENGPAVGENYWRFNASNVMFNAGPRPSGISNNDGYDIIPSTANAKNILTIGAVNPISTGYSKVEDVVMSSFSSWGPTDDGRIKPDVVADGVNVQSSIATSNTAYATYSGTSMSTPNASGSLLLLQEYYSSLHGGAFMRAATLKALAIHTADEAGAAPGPDYKFGWGLLNMAKAANVITANNTTDVMQENTLANGATYTYNVIASGNGPLVATIAWMDPKAGVVSETIALDNTDKKLVNDLDIVIKKGATIYRPWVMNPANPDAAPTTGINSIDNVEKAEVKDVVPGTAYTIEVTHKGTLERGAQQYSLLVSGIGSVGYCSSAPTSNTGAKIDSVSIGNVAKKNAAGCTTYSNFTNLTANLEPGVSIPLFIRLASCDATTANRIIKVYIDANNDGDFTDANETLATSAVLAGNVDYSTNIILPSTLTPGKTTVLRVVMQEGSVAASVQPCGTYANGETQDYLVLIAAPSSDAGITEVVFPTTGSCAGTGIYPTVRLKNFGTVAKSNIPVTVVIKNGATTVATITGTYPATIAAGAQVSYTLQTPFNFVAGTTYTVEANTTLAGDQSVANDKLITTIAIAAAPVAPSGTAVFCPSNNVAVLNATNVVTGAEYFWYNATPATVPIARGATTNTTAVPANKTFYLGTGFQGKVGLASKDVYPGAGRYFDIPSYSNYMKYTAQVDLNLESVKLFTKNPGTVTITVGDLNEAGTAFTILSSKTFDVYSTNPNPVVGTVDATAADAASDPGAVFNVDMSLPAGSHTLFVITSGATIFRNANVTGSPYPFTIPNVISLTGNSATLATDVNYFQNFYYFLYDLKVKTAGCVSPLTTIVATTPPTPVVTQAGNVLTSSVATGNQWYKDGVAIPGAIGQTYTVTADGVYKVQSTDGASGCQQESAPLTVTTTAVNNIDPAAIGLTVAPNPSNGEFVVRLETNTKADLGIKLLNANGQQMYLFNQKAFIGRLTRMINVTQLANGIYYLEVHHDKKKYIRKIVISH